MVLANGSGNGSGVESIFAGDLRLPVVFERPIGFPDEFLRLSSVTAALDEFRRKELMVFPIGVSPMLWSRRRALT